MIELPNTTNLYSRTIKLFRSTYFSVFPFLALLAACQCFIDNTFYLVDQEKAYWNVVLQMIVPNIFACFMIGLIYVKSLVQKISFSDVFEVGFLIFKLFIPGTLMLGITAYSFHWIPSILNNMISITGFSPLKLTVLWVLPSIILFTNAYFAGLLVIVNKYPNDAKTILPNMVAWYLINAMLFIAIFAILQFLCVKVFWFYANIIMTILFFSMGLSLLVVMYEDISQAIKFYR